MTAIKQFILGSLVVFLLLPLLTGCGSPDETDDTDSLFPPAETVPDTVDSRPDEPGEEVRPSEAEETISEGILTVDDDVSPMITIEKTGLIEPSDLVYL